MTGICPTGIMMACEAGKPAFTCFAKVALRYPRQHEQSEVLVVGNPHTNAKNVERLIGEGYRFLMSAPMRSYGVVGQGRELAGY